VGEAVFSSTGFRIRAAQGQAADHGPAKHGLTERDFSLTDHGLAQRGFSAFAERATASLFFAFFPADCRIIDSPLPKVFRLPVCNSCLTCLAPLEGSYCFVCGEGLYLAAFASIEGEKSDRLGEGHGETRCELCQRLDPPFERAVACGSYDGESYAISSICSSSNRFVPPREFWRACGPRRLPTWNQQYRLEGF
jgi:hypothetical protein